MVDGALCRVIVFAITLHLAQGTATFVLAPDLSTKGGVSSGPGHG